MKKAISVSQLNLYIKNLLGSDENLSSILVRGEISNFKKHFSGHMYFTLKDNKAAVKCIMFSSYAGRLAFNPTDGMQVTVAGYVSVYEKSGQYQLYAADMIEEGEGALYLEFEKLKKQLLEEGLFDESKKKAIPMMPDSIGVVTSATGSVIKDIINVLDRRFPKYHLILYPSNVQGAGAELEIAAGIRYFNEVRQTDVIIIARGGGSIEDLWPFNKEHLARAIYASKVPVISAVGHETDFTIADFTADKRAPTPSAAAEIAVPELSLIKDILHNSKGRLRNSLIKSIQEKEAHIKSLKSRPVLARPEEIFNMMSLTMDRAAEKLHIAFKILMEGKETQFKEMTAKLDILSPLGTIARGYSVIVDGEKHVITSIRQVAVGDKIRARVSDGVIIGKVSETEENNGKTVI